MEAIRLRLVGVMASTSVLQTEEVGSKPTRAIDKSSKVCYIWRPCQERNNGISITLKKCERTGRHGTIVTKIAFPSSFVVVNENDEPLFEALRTARNACTARRTILGH